MILTLTNRNIGQEYQFNNNDLLLSFFDNDGNSESFPMTMKPKLVEDFIRALKENGFRKEAI